MLHLHFPHIIVIDHPVEEEEADPLSEHLQSLERVHLALLSHGIQNDIVINQWLCKQEDLVLAHQPLHLVSQGQFFPLLFSFKSNCQNMENICISKHTDYFYRPLVGCSDFCEFDGLRINDLF